MNIQDRLKIARTRANNLDDRYGDVAMLCESGRVDGFKLVWRKLHRLDDLRKRAKKILAKLMDAETLK